jgi:thioesterase domain-containing protein
LFRKSHNTAAIMSYQGHVLMENRSGLVVGAVVTHADGMGERVAALAMLDTLPGKHPKTVAADKAYDTRDFIAACRQRNVTPMWPATPRASEAVPSMGELPDTAATQSAKQSESESKNILDGVRPWAGSGRPCTVESNGLISTSN